jgi:polygalacturonase
MRTIALTFAAFFLATCLLVQGQVAPVSSRSTYNVRDFGATGDGKTLDSPAIDRAIAAASEAGGGTVHIPAGTYLSGSIHLKSNIHLYLDAGAVIRSAPQEMNAYDPPEPFEGIAYQDGGHTYFHNSLIWGENQQNISITGPGMIDGGGLTKKDKKVGEGAIGLGDKAIALKLCRNVLIRDITIFNGGHFAIITTGCDLVTIDNVTIDTNRDGINLDCCTNTVVSNCRINSPFDDGLCLKSSYALQRPVITENVTITNCQLYGYEVGTLLDGTRKPSQHQNGRIKLGTESNGGFRNISVSNCIFRECRGLALEMVDGGILENVTISNIAMMEVAWYPIFIRLGSRNRGPAETTKTGKIRNVFISDMIATGIGTMSGIQITGIPGHYVEGVRLENIRLLFDGGGTAEDAQRVPPEDEAGYPEPNRFGTMPSYGLFARHVRDLELQDVRVGLLGEDKRPPVMCVDVDGLEFDNFKADVLQGVKAARFEQVKGLKVRDSPVLKSMMRK